MHRGCGNADSCIVECEVVVMCFGKRFGRRGKKGRPKLREEAVESKGCRLDVALVKGPALKYVRVLMNRTPLVERRLYEWLR